jgi:hypothetical protein
MENSDIDIMIDDFVKRHKWDVTKEEVVDALTKYPNIICEDGFFVFDIYYGKLIMFFAYVVPGKDARKWWDFFENYARFRGCKKVTFATKRAKAFKRYFPDYKESGIIFEKEV